MNSPNQGRGQHPASAVTGSDPDQDNMKRQAAEQLIRNYYMQLTDGCGNSDCDNPSCASSPDFTFRAIDRNKLALQAVTLSRQRARLCDAIPQKYAKFPVQETAGTSRGQGSSAEPASLPGGSGSSAHFGGAKVKQGHCTTSASSSGSSQSSKTEEITFLDEEMVNSLVTNGRSSGNWNRLIRTIGSVFSNPDSLMLSFHLPSTSSSPSSPSPTTSTPHSRTEVQPDPDKDVDDTEAEAMSVDHAPIQESGDVGGTAQPSTSSTDSLSAGDTGGVVVGPCCVDLPSLQRTYDLLLSLPGLPFQGALINALTSLARALQMDFKYHHTADKNPLLINIFVIIMEYPHLHSPEYLEAAFPAFCKALGLLPLGAQARLSRVWAAYGTPRLTDMLHMLQQLITVRIINHEGRWGRNFQLNDDEAVSGACSVMKVVYYASLLGGVRDSPQLLQEEKAASEADVAAMAMEGAAMGMEPKEPSQPKEDPLAALLSVVPLNVRVPMIPPAEFVNEPLNEHIDISTDYAYYRSEPENKFSFMLHSFVLNTASKHMQMYFDNRIRMLQERRTSLLQTIMNGGPPMPYLRLQVRRSHVVDDALVNLEMMAMENPADLKKQLFVEFEGEQGLDEGGVSKEFFQLIVEELFNPDIGMFTFNEGTQQFWFNPLSFETESQFTLIGIVIGLAIYNSCILNVQLPMVVYRKLLGKKGVFQDLMGVDPTLARSLQQVLDFEGEDLEDVLLQTFRIGFKDIFGNNMQHDLKDGAGDILVTQTNKQEFVELYADFILNKSIDSQFRAFRKGFLMVTNESPLCYLFRPDEVEQLVCGCKEYDFCALEQSTEYDGGFTTSSPTVKNFWEVVHEFREEDKKRLLQFTTGSDRVPVGGLAKLKIIIARNGSDSEKLPTSHTCFNVLLLPDYSTKEKLKERLLKAVMYAQGFGML